MRAVAGVFAKAVLVMCALSASIATGILTAPAGVASATNDYGPGLGTMTPGTHWGGAYALQGVPGYGYCIDPGAADPAQLPTDTWTPVPYPGSALYTNGEMAALAFFAERYQGTGYNGYSIDQTDAAIAEVAYASAGGVTPPTSAAPTVLVATLETWIHTYAGPWAISLTMNPPSGSNFTGGQTYSGTVTITSATGFGVGGLTLTTPPVGGPANHEISSFEWLAATTNSAGQISFEWDIAAPATASATFTAPGIAVEGGAPGLAPPTYAAPAGSGGQVMLVSGISETLGTGFQGTVSGAQEQTGTLSIHKTVPDPAYYGPGGAVFEIVNTAGTVVDTLTTGPTGSTPTSTALPTAPTGTLYTVKETAAPAGYSTVATQTVLVRPGKNALLTLTGAVEEPVLVGQLGAAKVDAQTNQPLVGATFDFRFDPENNGTYSVDLGSCTTGTSGICQPPDENAPGGWLPGWYQVTETAAPAGYWLNPATATVDTFVNPGATDVATVTFADNVLGSLQLSKTGDDTAYLPVAGAVFSVAGPQPTTTVVGTLTVATDGTTNILTGLVPGSYTVTETTAPSGYELAPPFTVAVTAGHATTETSVTDTAQSGELLIEKTDATTGDPLAGAVFDTRFDATNDGDFTADLGDCTTNASGTCAPTGNDGTGFLPGSYEVTETAAPPGFALPTPAPSAVLTVPTGGTATFSFADHRLVPASFAKVATGNVNADELILSGAVIDVTAGTSYGGTPVASCTTDTSGRCTTAATLVAGRPYCWDEVTAPAGLAAGATGCFTASEAGATEPITVTDAGMFVAVQAKKVDATHPATPVAGATFDLYRAGSGPEGPTPPAGAPTETGYTWVAQATSGPDGTATFPLQLPGYAYCTVEQAAPPGYVVNPALQCTGVLSGSTVSPPPVVTLTTADPEATVTLSVHKYNAASPTIGIAGALYDVYVEGSGPPSGPPVTTPSGAPTVPGDRWWAQGTTGTSGLLQFTVPAGYSWCIKEQTAPVDYAVDAGLHCTGVLWTTSPPRSLTLAVPETLAMVTVYTHKFNAQTPKTTVPGATYELVGVGTPPPGWTATSNPNAYPVPSGDWFVGTAVTGATGVASWTVPAGSSWCLHEVSSPPDYELDTGWHCTTVLTTASTPQDETVAIPEVPVPALAYTGGPPIWLGGAGVCMVGTGGLAALVSRRRRRSAA